MVRRTLLRTLAVTLSLWSCSYDKAYRQDVVPPSPPICALGARRCDHDALQSCETGIDGRPGWAVRDDCGSRALTCGVPGLGCTTCAPGRTTCGGDLRNRTDTCRDDGSGYAPGAICDGAGMACRDGICGDLCAVARKVRSNVGCEYWAVDLDNANISPSLNAAAQQYAVVVSNPVTSVPRCRMVILAMPPKLTITRSSSLLRNTWS